MKAIPLKLRKELSEDPFYKKCCLSEKIHECMGRVEWHHNFIFAGRQCQEKFAILPICHAAHELVYKKDFRNRLDWIMINRMTDEDFKKYHKPDWGHKKRWLNKLFGTPKKLN